MIGISDRRLFFQARIDLLNLLVVPSSVFLTAKKKKKLSRKTVLIHWKFTKVLLYGVASIGHEGEECRDI